MFLFLDVASPIPEFHIINEKKIKSLINKLKDKNIMTLYENEILDTGGGVKNAIPFFKNKNLLITNSDVFWLNKNIQDAKKLIENYFINRKPHMLLINKNNAIGLNNKEGDFILNDNKILRFKKGDKIFFYSGLQMLSTNIFDIFDKKNFSFNDVWDYLILKKELNGHVMKSNCYHVGDIQGLNIAKDIES